MSENQLTVTNGKKRAGLIEFDDEKVNLIKRTVAPKATDDELALFLHQCKRTGLDPLARQIYFQKYSTKSGPRVSIITGIDGYRLIADRTGQYAGNDDAVFEGRQEQARYKEAKQVPVKATVTVWKIVGNKRVPFTASAYWDEYYPGDKMGHMWFKMPHVMLSKVAEALALRKAFPADLSGVYTRDEMTQAEADWEPVEQPQIEQELEPQGNGNTEPSWMGEGGETTITDKQMKALHAAGSGFYGDEWDKKRPELVKSVTDGRTESSKELTTGEARRLIDGINKRANEA